MKAAPAVSLSRSGSDSHEDDPYPVSIGSIRIFDNSVIATRLTTARRALVTERAGRPTLRRVNLPGGLPLDTRVLPSVASALPLGTPARGDTMETRQRVGECLLRFLIGRFDTAARSRGFGPRENTDPAASGPLVGPRD